MSLLITGARGAAGAAGIKAGNRLVAINGEPVLDFIDFNWFSVQEHLILTTESTEGVSGHTINKLPEEPIGLDVEGLYPDERRCANRCVFCFVDQMPKEMRESLYVKDDDWRYSVLFGNYITLTNISDHEFERILKRKPSPLYVSVHATDPQVRSGMMGNVGAARIMEQLKRLVQAGIAVHCQVVLVPGINDGAVLEKTLCELYALHPGVRTVAVVPVGLTSHRESLPALKPVKKEDALAAISAVEAAVERSQKDLGMRFAFASDEMYERAGLPCPRYSGGEHSPQLANGVGMASDFLDEFEWALGELPSRLPHDRSVTVITGVSAYGMMEKLAGELTNNVENLAVRVLCVKNELFGPQVTVAGLLCGADILRAATGRTDSEVLVSQSMLRSGGDVFLDGMTVDALSRSLGAPVCAVPCDGASFAFAACGLEEDNG